MSHPNVFLAPKVASSSLCQRRLKIDPLSLLLFLVGCVLFEEFSSGSGPVGLSVEGKDFGVMNKPVDHCCGHDVVSDEAA